MNGRPVLLQVNLAAGPGEIVALTGENGAGKTTLLRCLAGRLRVGSGEILWFGKPPRPARNHLIGLAAHEDHLYPELTVDENLLFAARMYGLDQPAQRVAHWLTKTGLSRIARQRAGRLSQGQRRRLSLAQALIHDPPIVLLDEPLAGLDAAGREWFAQWLCELRDQERAIIFSTHDEEPCRSLADHRWELAGGRIRHGADVAHLSLARSA
jgi:heme ABC exporter ATP-binding subunit CcmA